MAAINSVNRSLKSIVSLPDKIKPLMIVDKIGFFYQFISHL